MGWRAEAPMILTPETLAFLMTAALTASCIDAMAGGGGLITLPALMAAGIPPVQAVATNKLQSCFGTFGACLAYARRGHMDLKTYKAPVIAAFIGSVGGAWLLQRVDPSILAGGIWVALLTTAAGLVVAMPTALALSWLEGRMDAERTFSEKALLTVLSHTGKKDTLEADMELAHA